MERMPGVEEAPRGPGSDEGFTVNISLEIDLRLVQLSFVSRSTIKVQNPSRSTSIDQDDKN
jgi:hypothetical protein